MNLAKQNDDKFTASLGATLSTMRQENKARLARVEERIDENVNALGAMLHRTSTEEEVREFPQEVSKNMRWKKVLKTRIVQQNQSHVLSCNLKTEGSKRLSPSHQKTAIHYRAENHRVQNRLKPRTEILAKAIVICRNTTENTSSTQLVKYH